jgi:archaemetzincin
MKIYLVPIGPLKDECLELIRNELSVVFKADIEVMSNCPVPESSLNQERGQYDAPALLKYLASCLPELAPDQKVLGIIDADIYAENLDFLFGLSDKKTGHSLISLVRLRPEFSGHDSNNKLFCCRIVKEAVHEIGHTLGFNHCQYSSCVMHFSAILEDTDRKDSRFCYCCREKFAARQRDK